MSDARRLQLPAALTHREAPTALRSMGVTAEAAGASWHIDASALVDFDSSALAVLLACKRMASSARADLVIEHAPAKLVRLAGLYGLEELLPEVVEAAATQAPSPATS